MEFRVINLTRNANKKTFLSRYNMVSGILWILNNHVYGRTNDQSVRWLKHYYYYYCGIMLARVKPSDFDFNGSHNNYYIVLAFTVRHRIGGINLPYSVSYDTYYNVTRGLFLLLCNTVIISFTHGVLSATSDPTVVCLQA